MIEVLGTDRGRSIHQGTRPKSENHSGATLEGLYINVDNQEAMQRLAQTSERENAGTTSLGALLRAKLDNQQNNSNNG